MSTVEPGIPPAEAARRLPARFSDTGDRHLLWLGGSRPWTLAAARQILSRGPGADASWLGDRHGAADPNQRTIGLGGECGLLVVDAWAGLDLDALGAAVGTLRGGGLLLLLSPAPADWTRLADPGTARFLSFPHDLSAVGTRTLERICRHLRTSPAVTTLFEHGETAARLGWTSETTSTQPERRLQVAHQGRIRSPAETAADRPPEPEPTTRDQAEAIAAVLEVAAADTPAALVLTADRGRGKSAAMGIAARRLAAQGASTILLTAPRRAAAEAVLRHAGEAAPRFVAPDVLLRDAPPADLLLVDEAASIPAPLLQGMLVRWSRVVFATTVHGYEGTGRGFELRFGRVLDRLTPGWRHLRLRQPIRWAENDPLERLIDDLLLLDAEPARDATVARLDATSQQDRIHSETLDRDRLSRDEALLRQVFGLLVLGHYQTRPSDLRQMLDAPDIAVHVLRAGATVLGVAVTGREGRLPAALHGPIFEGRRRPRGHLLPQTLSAHAGLREAPCFGFSRILRIAVHPAARRRGFGKRLMKALAERALDDGADLIGASFGATPVLLDFWYSCGLSPVHLGHRRNAASGAHAAVVLAGLSAGGRRFAEMARKGFPERLRQSTTERAGNLEPEILAALLADGATPARD